MLELTMGGYMMGPLDAIEVLEMLPDNIPDEVKDDDFCEEYERALNRFRFEIRKRLPVTPKVVKAVSRGYGDQYTCGGCGFGIRRDIYKFCPHCGQRIDWRAI